MPVAGVMITFCGWRLAAFYFPQLFASGSIPVVASLASGKGSTWAVWVLQAAQQEAQQLKKLLEDSERKLETATSEALASKQQAAALAMDLANAEDRHRSELELAASELEAAVAARTSRDDQVSSPSLSATGP